MTESIDSRTCGRHCFIESSEMYFLATLSPSDFYELRALVDDLLMWPTYDDFVMERDGCFLGMSWAGMSVVQVDVSAALFHRWLERTAAPRELRTLDDFAMRLWLRSSFPAWGVRPVGATLGGEANGHLDIPLPPTTLGQGRGLLNPPTEMSIGALAEAIARDCLDR